VRGTARSTALAAPRKPVSGHRSADRVRDSAKGISGGASASVKRCGRRSASRPQLPGACPDLSEPRALRGRACIGPSGIIRMITPPATCGANQTPVQWNVGGPTGPQGPTGPTGPQGPVGPAGPAIGFSVFDSNGTKVGNPLQLNTQTGTVVLAVDGFFVPLDVTGQGFAPSRQFLWFINSTDCSGPAFFLAAPVFPPMSLVALAPPGRTIYVPDPAGVPVILDTFDASQFQESGGCQRVGGNCCAFHFVPAKALRDLSTLGFSPPFSLR